MTALRGTTEESRNDAELGLELVVRSDTGMGEQNGIDIEAHAAWPLLSRLPVHMAAAIPVAGFTVRDLLQMTAGRLIESAWPGTEDIPLKAGAVQVSWSEFEVVEQHMAVRLTRLA
jgi:flagellar motor switch protein FliN/FliY